MSNKKEQSITLAVAVKMNIDVDKYIHPNGSYEDIKYDMDGVDEEIKSINQKVFDLKVIYFSARKMIDDNKDEIKPNELSLAKIRANEELYDFVKLQFGK